MCRRKRVSSGSENNKAATNPANRPNEPAGPFEFQDAVDGQEWAQAQAFLPVVMPAFIFAFGLECRRVAEGDAIAVQRGSELSERLGRVGKERGVIVHVESQGQGMPSRCQATQPAVCQTSNSARVASPQGPILR
jgi:hypothetical protein